MQPENEQFEADKSIVMKEIAGLKLLLDRRSSMDFDDCSNARWFPFIHPFIFWQLFIKCTYRNACRYLLVCNPYSPTFAASIGTQKCKDSNKGSSFN